MLKFTMERHKSAESIKLRMSWENMFAAGGELWLRIFKQT